MNVLSLLLPPTAPVPDAGRLGRRMAALYRSWDGRRPVDLVALAADLLGPGSISITPIAQACLHVADVVARWGGHPYHSARHHAEVATNAAVLADLMDRPLPPDRRAVLLAAALSHDLNYEPGPPRARFTAERVAAEAMDLIAGRFGIAQAERDDIRVLILATEPGFRPHLASLLRASRATAALPDFLQPLGARPELAGLAAILSDADLLSSSGLTRRWRQVQRARLERELGHGIAPAADLAFFDRIVADGYLSHGGRHFTPNLLRIRQTVRDELAPGDRA